MQRQRNNNSITEVQLISLTNCKNIPSETLLHEHIDYGIKKIVERLDYIIKQNQAIIFNQHRQEARNQTMIDQNQKMLSTLRRTEANTEQTANMQNYLLTIAGHVLIFQWQTI